MRALQCIVIIEKCQSIKGYSQSVFFALSGNFSNTRTSNLFAQLSLGSSFLWICSNAPRAPQPGFINRVLHLELEAAQFHCASKNEKSRDYMATVGGMS